MINFLAWIIVGGLVGLIASIIWVAGLRTHDNGQQHSLLRIMAGILLNVIAGIFGAFFAGLVITPLIGGGTIAEGGLSLSALLMSLLGAIVALAIVNLIRRRIVR